MQPVSACYRTLHLAHVWQKGKMSKMKINIKIALELMPNGSLDDVLFGESQISLSESDKSSIVGDIINGIRYIHNQKITHRDIKPGNILVSQNLTAKVCLLQQTNS